MLDELFATITKSGGILNLAAGRKCRHEQRRIAQQVTNACARHTACAWHAGHESGFIMAGSQSVHERNTA
jgi:hypothetical protein